MRCKVLNGSLKSKLKVFEHLVTFLKKVWRSMEHVYMLSSLSADCWISPPESLPSSNHSHKSSDNAEDILYHGGTNEINVLQDLPQRVEVKICKAGRLLNDADNFAPLQICLDFLLRNQTFCWSRVGCNSAAAVAMRRRSFSVRHVASSKGKETLQKLEQLCMVVRRTCEYIIPECVARVPVSLWGSGG